MNAQNETQLRVRSILDEVSSTNITGNNKLDSLIRIRELLTKIEESELIKSEINEDLWYDYFNLSLAFENINTSSEVEAGIFRVLSSHYRKKASLINHQIKKLSNIKKTTKK